MRVALIFLLGAMSGGAAAMLPKPASHFSSNRHRGSQQGVAAKEEVRAHTEEKFAFTAHAPFGKVAPLFGADGERAWAPGWDPEFLYPSPVRDIQGMVFKLGHGPTQAAWVNTEFNLKDGRVQYVYFLPDILITVISLKLTPMGNETRVEVEYARTALSVGGIARVQHMAEQDRIAGPEWETQVNGYLRTYTGP